MRAVVLQVPEQLLAERRSRGHDRFDEMWEGELHMVPPPSGEHQRFGTRLLEELLPVARAAGALVTYETGLFDPGLAGAESYRQPDLAVYRPEVASERGIEGRALLVVEIRSPGDETLEKVPFYSRVGVCYIALCVGPHQGYAPVAHPGRAPRAGNRHGSNAGFGIHSDRRDRRRLSSRRPCQHKRRLRQRRGAHSRHGDGWPPSPPKAASAGSTAVKLSRRARSEELPACIAH